MRCSTIVLTTCLVLAPSSAWASDPFAGFKLQTPELSAPQRGSLSGQLARVAFGPADMGRGAFTLATPFSAPEDRGPLLVAPFPSYSIDAGLGEWGAGWQNNLAIVRGRLAGDLDYANDDLNGPWGRMIQGDDGAFYPVGLRSLVRVEEVADTLLAYLPDGSTWTFGGKSRIAGSGGTYAWYLTEAVSSIGRRAKLEYISNPSGRLFVSRVSYGGVGEDLRYRIDFVYQTVTAPADYKAGKKLVLDRRVKTVTVLAQNQDTGLMQERWHYDLSYDQDGQSPAFYLKDVKQVFASGEAAPSSKYSYRRPSDQLAALASRRVAKLDALIAQYGADVVEPDRSTLYDADLDGRADLELAGTGQLLRQRDDDFSAEALPARNDSTDTSCRPPDFDLNPPRTLAELRADDPAFQVISTQADATLAQTALVVCQRDGQRLASYALSGNWQTGATTKLVDLNRDHRPDLVRVFSGGYQILVNESDAGGYGFSAPQSGTLTPAVQVTAAWGQDFNGDGIVDLVVRSSGELRVWYGLGGLQFVTAGQLIPFTNFLGPVTISASDEITFVDVNRDGLTDVLVTTSTGSLSLYVNRGSDLRSTTVPGLAALPFLSSRPVVADLAGTGNTEIVVTAGGQAYGLAVDAPAVGLMTSADDGRGTRLDFEYDRAAPSPSARDRQTVLSALTVTSTGVDPIRYSYAYDSPRVHSVGRFLIGFDDVLRQSPTAVQSISFLNEDRYSAVPLLTRTHDTRLTDLDRIEQDVYDDASWHGIPRKRLRQSSKGWAGPTPLLLPAELETTEYLAYEDDICPSQIQDSDRHGTKLTEQHRLHLDRFARHALCLYQDVTITGQHPDPSFDFRYQARLAYDDNGQLLSVEGGPPDQSLVLQEATYVDTRLQTVGSPGRGVTSYDYEPGTDLIAKMTTPDGHTVSAERDPITDHPLHLVTARGTAHFEQFFREDKQERLQKSWHNLLAASETAPNDAYLYQFATSTRPAAVQTTTLVDAQSGIYRRAEDLSTAFGDPLVSAHAIPEGWGFGELVERSPGVGQTRREFRAANATDPAALDLATLFGNTTERGSATADAFGNELLSATHYHANVTRQSSTTLALTDDGLERSELENGQRTTLAWLDAEKRVLRRRDPAGAEYEYRYDVLGRLREVQLPDGALHRVELDAYGRPSRITRTGVGAIAYEYAPQTGLLVSKTTAAPSGDGVRQEQQHYDSIGRVDQRVFVDLVSNESETFHFYYDGSSASSPQAPDELGLLSAVTGPGFEKTLHHRADGSVSRQEIAIASWRKIVTDFDYEEDGSSHGRTVTIEDAGGQTLQTSSEQRLRDAFGRVQSLVYNDQPIATFGYSFDGQPGTATFGDASASFVFEDFAHQAIGLRQAQVESGWSAETIQTKNDRGSIGTEQLSVGVGAAPLTRSYEYSAQGFLQSATDALATSRYEYDTVGLPTHVEDALGLETFVSNGHDLSSAHHNTSFDSIGRVVARDGVNFSYGPRGDIARASNSASEWTYVYDENGKRLAKLSAGRPIAAYLDEGYLTNDGLTEPVRFGGRLIGALRGGVFELAPTDQRGTALGDVDGSANLPSPFGNRAVHPSLAAAFDFAGNPFDADLGLVRLGVRDYDPALARFMRPDPFVFEAPDLCVQSPAECNLYSYAKDDPLSYVDPSGMAADDAEPRPRVTTKNGDYLGPAAGMWDYQRPYNFKEMGGRLDTSNLWLGFGTVALASPLVLESACSLPYVFLAKAVGGASSEVVSGKLQGSDNATIARNAFVGALVSGTNPFGGISSTTGRGLLDGLLKYTLKQASVGNRLDLRAAATSGLSGVIWGGFGPSGVNEFGWNLLVGASKGVGSAALNIGAASFQRRTDW